ncbi:hypothetical protein U875_24980 [Pandoraea pnomenusa 3kgm]|uniref:AAA domain-containing protein n=1 Tax=Pandoraea pnomenusa TaxID=93220 RepID=UPI0004035346|nr:AAA domain-containing protein [Pandoraea pnomenusa]AIM43892.1 hypothetical protein U875_24980 [Pandoraea pnomenusa 3kgm]
MSATTSSSKKVSKSTMSMFLRTRCDKELYLSLFDKRTIVTAGLPQPVKRPGIGILSLEGRAFEVERNDQLVRVFPGLVLYSKGGGSYKEVDLATSLAGISAVPAIILQAKFSVGAFKNAVLQNIGLTPTDISYIPDIADFVPDVLVVRKAKEGDFEILPDGARKEVCDLVETRFAIDVFDVKHTSEANPSYCSEIAMYALMLSNWLAAHPIYKQKFYVTTDSYLWTRFKQGDSELERLETAGGATPEQLLDALVMDSEDANLRFYLSAVRRFFEDVARVVRIAETASTSWRDLEWHVSSSCGSCDWLGDKRHLSKGDHAVVDAKPADYCVPEATNSGHLSLIPGITRGAKKVLQRNLIYTATDLAAAAGSPAFQQHTVLKRDARHLPARSTAILSGAIGNDPGAAIASLAKSAHLLIYASVNFDSSSGLLTGLALSGVATAFQSGVPPRRFVAIPYVVDQKSLKAEWVALEGFLSQIADWIATAESMVAGTVTGQIHFWEERQFVELCNAMGRHLPKVLSLTDRKAKALAWVFPADELIATPASLAASTVVTVEDIVRRMVFTPTPHVVTLFDTAEHFPAGPVQTVKDPYYREYLSNGIPRERIYELWSGSDPVKRGATSFPRNTLIHHYSEALAKQSKALESVCERLRREYGSHFRANSTHIPSSVPRGATGVAFDGKLWVWWDDLDFNASQLEAHVRLSLDGEHLEASYEAILLTNGHQVAAKIYEFDVPTTSTEAKFKEDSMLTLGKLGRPGMPLERASTLIKVGSPRFTGKPEALISPLWSQIQAKLLNFDRAKQKARVQLDCSSEPDLIPYLIANSSVNLLNEVFLLETKKPKIFNWSKSSHDILKEVGNPSIALPDPNAANAMGILPAARRGGRDPIKPIARVLWDAPALEKVTVATAASSVAIGAYAASQHGLNASQEAAVQHAVERALTVIWGPPGTGKTKTLAAFLDALSNDAHKEGGALKILVTGPTYKAVEEVMFRTADMLAKGASTTVSMYFGYSASRQAGPKPTSLPPSVQYTPMTLDDTDADYQACRHALSGTSGIVIVGCQIRQARRFSKSVMGSYVQPLFDVVVIDESSQVPVSQALAALCGLKESARLIVAGDHLQMPPITSIEAPCDAAYLVGSIQTYLRERPFGSKVPVCILETNYRSAKDIVAFAVTIGYPSTLTAASPDISLHFNAALPGRDSYPSTLPWCDEYTDLLSPENHVVTLLHDDEVSSQGNHFEAATVAGAVWMLRQGVSGALDGTLNPVSHGMPSAKEFWTKCIGIVTPHRAQRALIIQELDSLFPGEKNLIEEAVDTVERFQGGERHTIFVTFGVGDTDVIGGEEAFLMQLERTNVAVSRAMAKCVIVMPKTLAAYIPEDKRVIATAYALKNYIDDYCSVVVNTVLDSGAEKRPAQIRYHR